MSAGGVLALARPDLREFAPYVSARMEADEAVVMLNANESWPTAGDVVSLNRYPDPQPPILRRHLAKVYGVREVQLLVTRGSDEGMDLLVRAFCRAGEDAVLTLPPTFGMYAVCAAVQGARIIEVPLDKQFAVDPDAVLESLASPVKLVFLCSPNNPTGNLVPLAVIERLATELAGRAVLVVDEAYIEFADAPSAAALLDRHENLVVLRTLSKAWALAAARIGAVLAHPQVIALLRRILAPYPLPDPAVQAALQGLLRPQAMRERVLRVRRERERMASALTALPEVSAVLPSDANFLAVRFHHGRAAWASLCEAGIIVRDLRARPRLGDALRITIGRREDNDAVLAALSRIFTREALP